MEVVFSFDTEDYVDPVSNDALKGLAESHTRHGVPACFGLVGEKARFIRNCGRHDVIEAVSRHEVGYHSDHHFMQPDYDYEHVFTPEYMERESWDRGVARLISEESQGIHDVTEIFGARPVTWLRTYGDWAPQYLAAFERLGIGVFAYGPPFHILDPQPIWYCNQLIIANPRMSYESNLHREDMTAEEKLEGHRRAFLKHLESGTERLGIVTHPTRFISDIWWEEPNWWDGIVPAPPRERWIAPPHFTEEKIKELLWIADEFIAFVGGLGEVECKTFRQFWETRRPAPGWMGLDAVRQVAGQIRIMGTPCAVEIEGGTYLSPAEAFGVFVFALANPAAERIPIRTMFGPTEEPHDTPVDRDAPHDDFLADCRHLELRLRDAARVPHLITTCIGAVGPGAFLLAMANALLADENDAVPVRTTENMPPPLHDGDYDTLASRAPCSYIQKRGELDFARTIRHSQLQYWSVKPA
ncbi:MAG: hypothetical protein HN742_04450 [Lentisphaerae bacterium]|jgi:hypothetical protein|nr:hypothetical protein [Lentisphaerota bacterium]MBT4815263.1 hypothetical protein [Lentisphaerota bacterium]MBT5610093.1 hypothetical protein [Lentisphaerota bacterium]MBT7061634.1 hypothetical protein [Lentisphaerota bacterium]MBT7841095.1 hypothetical protein [Lentisphaerota bacterium]